MKKRLAGILAVLAAAVFMAGCGEAENGDGGSLGESADSSAEGAEQSGSADDSTDAFVLNEIKVEDYVTLGDYGSFEVEVDKIGVDDADWKALMSEAYIEYITPEHGGITDRAVAMGDTVIIDYEGKKDGVAFAGGTAQNARLGIGSGQFIDGFEEGLVGVMPGATVDLNLSFPEQYGNAELAGQAVVFTVTVKCILPATVAEEEMEDVVVASMGIDGVSTVEEFKQYAYDYLYARYENEVQSGILSILLERCEFKELPEDMLEPYRQLWSQVLAMYASMYQTTVEQYATYFYQADSETVINQFAEQYLKQDLALQAIANKEGLKISDEELQEKLLEEARAAGYATAEEYVGTGSREDYRNDYMNDRVIGYLTEKTAVTEKQ